MNDVVIEIGLRNEIEETAFLQAVETFAKTAADGTTIDTGARTAPNLIIKTVCAANGGLAKRLIFQDACWANRFVELFEVERTKAA